MLHYQTKLDGEPIDPLRIEQQLICFSLNRSTFVIGGCLCESAISLFVDQISRNSVASHQIGHYRNGKGCNVTGHIVADIRLLEIVLLYRPHKRRYREKTLAMASEKELCRNNLVYGGKLPTGLLVNSGVQQIEIRNNRSTDIKKRFAVEVFLTGIPMLGLLLFCDQACPAEMLLTRVIIISLRVSILSQVNAFIRQRSDLKLRTRVRNSQISRCYLTGDWERNLSIGNTTFQFLYSRAEWLRLYRFQVDSVPCGNRRHLRLFHNHLNPVSRSSLRRLLRRPDTTQPHRPKVAAIAEHASGSPRRVFHYIRWDALTPGHRH